MKFINHAEGYIEPDGGGGYDYVYQYKDHLGNVRLSYSDSNADGAVDNTEIVEESNYYPFGLKHRGYNDVVNGMPNKFLTYNGKEFEEALGFNMHEMDMRHYDPAIARWVVQDPVTHHSMSPYNAFDNNPVFWADPSGADGAQDIIGSYGWGGMFFGSGGSENASIKNGWTPKVNEDGTTAYKAESGKSNAKTLGNQYGLDEKVAGALYSKMKKGVISGQDVYDETGSEVLTLNLDSKLATQQRVFDHIMFSRDHSTIDHAYSYNPKDYFSGGENVLDLIGSAILEIDGKKIRVHYEFPYERVFHNFSTTKDDHWRWSNAEFRTVSTPGAKTAFGESSATLRMTVYHPTTNAAQSIGAGGVIRHHSQYSNIIYSRINKRFPNPTYIRSTNVKN